MPRSVEEVRFRIERVRVISGAGRRSGVEGAGEREGEKEKGRRGCGLRRGGVWGTSGLEVDIGGWTEGLEVEAEC
jgi:hypothetical protein